MKPLVRLAIIGILLTAFFIPQQAAGQFLFFQNSLLGKAAPDFTLNTSAGNEINMEKLREGRNAIIFFWATWCPHCRKALRNLEKNKYEIQKKGIKLMLVDMGESREQVDAYLKANRINMEVFLDENSALSEAYAVEEIPTFVFIDRKGIVRSVQHSLPSDYEKLF